MEYREVTAADGTEVPITWFDVGGSYPIVVFMPALGVRASLYEQLGELFKREGIATCLIEQRGHGRSALRPDRGDDYGLSALLELDLPAVVAWLRTRYKDRPLVVGGHSLGGHISTLYAGQHPEQVTAVLHIACALPYYADYRGKNALGIRAICRLLPALARFPGYYPGDRLGFGGREAITMMRQWSEWASTGSFDFGGRTGLAEAVSAFRGPVLSINFKGDSFVSTKAINRALSPFVNARVTRLTLGPAEQGEYLGHSIWAREPGGVLRATKRWLQTLRLID